MELILISESKLKIMLTKGDMESYSITNEELDYENIDTREAFRSILDEAKNKTGFDSGGGRLFIKVFPSRNGGCEVYITKTSEEKDKTVPKKQTERQTRPRKKEYCIFLFDDINKVYMACSCLYKTGYTFESSLYAEDSEGRRNRYYLVLQEEGKPSGQQKRKRTVEKSDIAGEFGTRLGSCDTVPYIKEHCNAICTEKAVETIGKLL